MVKEASARLNITVEEVVAEITEVLKPKNETTKNLLREMQR